jgi:hypothetical protein
VYQQVWEGKKEMSQQQLDAQGEAHEALGTAVASYGQRVLNDPHILGNLVADLLPDLPRERSLLVAGAEAGIAAEMTQHVQEQHIDPDTAVQLVARTLAERRAIDPAASMWVATEYAQALGYQVRPFAALAPPGQAEGYSSVPPTLTAMPGQPVPGQSSPTAPVSPQVPPMPYPAAQAPPQGWPPQAQASPQAPPQSWPPQAQASPQAPPQSWPPQSPSQPPSWPPAQPPPTGRGSGNGRTRSLIAIGAAVGLVVVYLVVAAVAHTVPFAKSHPAAIPTPTPKPVSHSPTPKPTPHATLAAGVTPLVQLLPADINDPSTQCQPVKKPYSWSMPGLVSALSCGDQGLPNGYVDGYQMDTRADYETAWRNFNTWWGFDASSAASSCPPPGGSGQGSNGWNSKDFPQIQGQVVECEMESGNRPLYVWTMPTQNTFIIAVGAAGSSFSALNNWWVNSSGPANSPTTTPSATS